MYWYSDWHDQMEEVSKGLPSALKAAYRSGEHVSNPAMAARIAAHRSGQNYAYASGAWRQSQKRVGESARAKSRAVLEPESAPSISTKTRAKARLKADEVPASMRARRFINAGAAEGPLYGPPKGVVEVKAKPTGKKSTSGWSTKRKILTGVAGGGLLTGTAGGAAAHRRSRQRQAA